MGNSVLRKPVVVILSLLLLMGSLGTLQAQPGGSAALTARTQVMFGFNLFKTIVKKEGSKNVFISPTSIASALWMAYDGAAGRTRNVIAKALGIQVMSNETFNLQASTLGYALKSTDPKVEIAIANSIWVNKDHPVNPSFLKVAQKYFQAWVQNLDFGSPGAPAVINSWVSQNTNGKIPSIVGRISPLERLVLINAVYFNGKWEKKFDPSQTKERNFYPLSGGQRRHMMMDQSADYLYYENNDIQAIRLPYGGDGRFCMVIVLPSRKVSYQRFTETLDVHHWYTWVTEMRLRKGNLVLPKFKMEYSASLTPYLKDLGMGLAFSNTADFSLMGPKLKIDDVLHKTYVDVDEQGTEAAAVTSVMVGASAIHIEPKPFTMIVDHPFFFAIEDDETGTILFMGSVVNP